MKILRAKLYDLELAKQQSEQSAERRSQVGTGDRSERIRTYNYPQGRVTDHRVGLTLHRLEAVLNGDLDEIMDTCITQDQAKKLHGE
jgi:peptide chain release factor 1